MGDSAIALRATFNEVHETFFKRNEETLARKFQGMARRKGWGEEVASRGQTDELPELNYCSVAGWKFVFRRLCSSCRASGRRTVDKKTPIKGRRSAKIISADPMMLEEDEESGNRWGRR